MLIMCRILVKSTNDRQIEQLVGFYAVPRVGDHVQINGQKGLVVQVVHHVDTSPPDIHIDL
ncbi:hypothetical protein [Deinococcus cellulosilyticus]|uniref:Uncharacterized protein n=1 Tax=Deinococcus cellulosilyticus (strain DSM 18568 / NBRC 106333 / KACC 11606 / 5516J-15) TaxID=1223518 RepID=A0A511N1S0_DEIC1|nr:hypothetical protein [Deinococcus cellulosilyticus]GEM46803.1 hypothetical protein DC3_24380 [Deinococcus cellulosilyticus NBRC 106333 = KACC 11606]